MISKKRINSTCKRILNKPFIARSLLKVLKGTGVRTIVETGRLSSGPLPEAIEQVRRLTDHDVKILLYANQITRR